MILVSEEEDQMEEEESVLVILEVVTGWDLLGEEEVRTKLLKDPFWFKCYNMSQRFSSNIYLLSKQVLEPLTGRLVAVGEEVGIQTAQQVTVQPVLE